MDICMYENGNGICLSDVYAMTVYEPYMEGLLSDGFEYGYMHV